MKYKSVKGMEDILPAEIQLWRDLEKNARADLESHGYVEIRTPVLEETSVFTRSIGETTDIVSKEMFTFRDRKDRSLTLRPEGTAPIVRAYIEHSLDKVASVLRLYYIGPMFRAEKPQKGRSRQFHQIGVEVFGSSSVYADAEVIIQMSNMLKSLGLAGFILKLNSLGCKADKSDFAIRLKEYLEEKKSRLCQDCKDRMKTNPLRVLDCKNESCAQVVREAPDILRSLCPACRDHFNKLKSCLEKMKVEFKETKNLVRGLDYYTGPVFEIAHPSLGGQDAIGAGGRYDNLVKGMGGPDVPAVGYALGMERILLALKKELPPSRLEVIYIATIGDAAKIKGIQIAERLREELPRYVILIDITEASLKSQMRNADKNNAGVVLILGDDEIAKGEATLRDMKSKEQLSVRFEELTVKIKERMGRCCAPTPAES